VSDAPLETAEELYEHAPCGYMSSRPDGTIVRVNQTLLDWTGYSRGDIVGKHLRDFLPLPVKVFYETHYDPLLRMQGFVREMSLDLLCAGGKLLSVLANAVQQRDEAGQPLTTRTTIFDATERRRYERELLLARRRAQQLAAVVESSADAIMIAAPDGTVQTWNAGAEHLFGYSSREAVGVPVRRLIVPDDYADEFEQLLKSVRAGQQIQRETVRVRKDGSRVEVSLSLTPHIEPPGELTAISAITRDITERRRVESRLRRTEHLQSVATLAGGVAHEVNNQIAVVLGFGEFVLQALGENHSQRSDVQAIVRAGARIAGMTRQLLAFSRQLPMFGEDIRLTQLIERLVPALAVLLGDDKRLLAGPFLADTTVHGDPAQIEQILVELTSNARDAMSEGDQLTMATEIVHLTAEDAQARPGDEITPGPYAMISVSDNGSGIERELLDRIVEPFFTTRPVGQGTGLGLAMVDGIVRQHGGRIGISSERGRGTTVRVYLPTVSSTAPCSELATEPASSRGPSGLTATLESKYRD
jgi:PAS domain S-box-containing protein